MADQQTALTMAAAAAPVIDKTQPLPADNKI